MKFIETLRGYVFHDSATIEAIWGRADFCLDTNVLLDVYRYSEQSRTAFLKLIAALKPRLFIPHRVAVEFARNRVGVIRGHYSPHRLLKAKLQDALQEVSKKHPKHSHLPQLKEIADSTIKTLDDKFGDLERQHLALVSDDVVLKGLLEVIDEIGEPLSDNDIQKEYKRRKDGSIPPFCKIDDDKDEERRVGDVVIWMELMKQYEGKSKPLIFVTDDLKENWWQETGGGRRDPQPVLVQEAYSRIGAEVLFYTSERFNETAPARLGVQLPKGFAEETKKIRQEERLARDAGSVALSVESPPVQPIAQGETSLFETFVRAIAGGLAHQTTPPESYFETFRSSASDPEEQSLIEQRDILQRQQDFTQRRIDRLERQLRMSRMQRRLAPRTLK